MVKEAEYRKMFIFLSYVISIPYIFSRFLNEKFIPESHKIFTNDKARARAHTRSRYRGAESNYLSPAVRKAKLRNFECRNLRKKEAGLHVSGKEREMNVRASKHRARTHACVHAVTYIHSRELFSSTVLQPVPLIRVRYSTL